MKSRRVAQKLVQIERKENVRSGYPWHRPLGRRECAHEYLSYEAELSVMLEGRFVVETDFREDQRVSRN